MAEDNLFYVDITGMIKASGLGKAVLNNINDCLLSYVTSSEYGVSEEYDISDINDSKRRTISSEISSFLRDLNMIILIFAREKRKVLERLEEYRRLGYLDVPDYGDPNNPTIGVIGNSYYYYEGYPEMLKGFYNNDVNIDVAISSRIGLDMQKELLEAAAKGDKEKFNRLFREYIIEQFDKDKRYDDITKEMKKFESTCMTDYNIQDGEPTSIVWEGYRRMADKNRKQDAVVIEGMGLDENKEALRDITNMMLNKNDKMVIIIDDYGDHTEEEQKEMIEYLKKEHPDANIQINNAKTANHEVASALEKEWYNEAERDHIQHPNKVSTYTNARQTANALSNPLGLEVNKDYDGSTTGAYYCDSTYGVVQLPRNNFDCDKPVPGSTDSGTNDKTDNYMQLSPEDKAIVDPIVDKYKPIK